MSFKFRKLTKKELGLGIFIMIILGVLVYFGVTGGNKDKKNVVSEAIMSSDEKMESTEATEQSISNEPEIKSFIQTKLPSDYQAIVLQNGLVIGQKSNGSDDYDWEIYDTHLELINTVSKVGSVKSELAHTFNTASSVDNTAVEVHSENEVYSTILDKTGNLIKLSVREADPIGTSWQLGTKVLGEYDTIPVWSAGKEGGINAYVLYSRGAYRTNSFVSMLGATVIGESNKHGLFSSAKIGSGSKVFIYDAKLKDMTEEMKADKKLIPIDTLSIPSLASVTNINDNNVLLIKRSFGEEISSELYYADSKETFTFPSTMDILSFRDYTTITRNDTGEFVEDIGGAENYPYLDKESNKVGIVNKTGSIIKEPFASQMSKPNKNGVAPFRLDWDGNWGLINVNTGEIIKEPLAKIIYPFNDNGLSVMLESDGEDYALIDEKGDILEKDIASQLYPINNDNIAKYQKPNSADIGIIKFSFEDEEQD